MIIALAQEQIRRTAREAARQQAWKDGRGVLGLPIRGEGDDFPLHNSDLTVVFDLVGAADALVWSGQELVVRRRHEPTRYIAITRPGHEGLAGDDVQVMGSTETDWILQRAAAVEADQARLDTASAASGSLSVLTCLSSDCGLVGHPYSRRAEVQALALAGIHDQVHHRGTATAQAGAVAQVCWEVDGPDGVAIYRGRDIELAADLYGSSGPGSHLIPVLATAGER